MRPLIAGNWKMNGLAQQLVEIEAIAASVKATPPFADILICPPSTLIARAVQTAAGRIVIGGQDCHSEIAGPITGSISAEMLKDAGASAVIVGHSERRQHHGETDAMVAAKAKAAWRAGILAIICIGETESQRLDGRALSVCCDQIAGSVPEDMTLITNAIAYEPLWAIGTGRTATPGEIAEMHAHIRQCMVVRFGRREKRAHPVRRVGQSVQRTRDPGGAGSWRHAGRPRKPEGGGIRSNIQSCSGKSLTTLGHVSLPEATGYSRRRPETP
jgi:triosephosphate isomerase (TIM)